MCRLAELGADDISCQGYRGKCHIFASDTVLNPSIFDNKVVRTACSNSQPRQRSSIIAWKSSTVDDQAVGIKHIIESCCVSILDTTPNVNEPSGTQLPKYGSLSTKMLTVDSWEVPVVYNCDACSHLS